MIIPFDNILKEENFIQSELLGSLSGEDIYDGQKKGEYDVKLVVNGRDVEPKLLNELVTNIEKYVELEAKAMLEEKFDDVLKDIAGLKEAVEELKENLDDRFTSLKK